MAALKSAIAEKLLHHVEKGRAERAFDLSPFRVRREGTQDLNRKDNARRYLQAAERRIFEQSERSGSNVDFVRRDLECAAMAITEQERAAQAPVSPASRNAQARSAAATPKRTPQLRARTPSTLRARAHAANTSTAAQPSETERLFQLAAEVLVANEVPASRSSFRPSSVGSSRGDTDSMHSSSFARRPDHLRPRLQLGEVRSPYAAPLTPVRWAQVRTPNRTPGPGPALRSAVRPHVSHSLSDIYEVDSVHSHSHDHDHDHSHAHGSRGYSVHAQDDEEDHFSRTEEPPSPLLPQRAVHVLAAFDRSPTGESLSSLPSEARPASADRIEPIERLRKDLVGESPDEASIQHHSPSPAPSVPTIPDDALMAARKQINKTMVLKALRDHEIQTRLQALFSLGAGAAIKYPTATREATEREEAHSLEHAFSACRSGDLALVRNLLLSHPQYLNAMDDQGMSLLHVACASGRAEIVKLLLARGADIHLESGSGYTPIDVARNLGYPICERLLLAVAGERKPVTPPHLSAQPAELAQARRRQQHLNEQQREYKKYFGHTSDESESLLDRIRATALSSEA